MLTARAGHICAVGPMASAKGNHRPFFKGQRRCIRQNLRAQPIHDTRFDRSLSDHGVDEMRHLGAVSRVIAFKKEMLRRGLKGIGDGGYPRALDLLVQAAKDLPDPATAQKSDPCHFGSPLKARRTVRVAATNGSCVSFMI